MNTTTVLFLIFLATATGGTWGFRPIPDTNTGETCGHLFAAHLPGQASIGGPVTELVGSW